MRRNSRTCVGEGLVKTDPRNDGHHPENMAWSVCFSGPESGFFSVGSAGQGADLNSKPALVGQVHT